MKSCGFTDCLTLLGTVYAGGLPAVACLVGVYILMPSFILPVLQRLHEGHMRRRFVRRCSPMVGGEGGHPLLPGKTTKMV